MFGAERKKEATGSKTEDPPARSTQRTWKICKSLTFTAVWTRKKEKALNKVHTHTHTYTTYTIESKKHTNYSKSCVLTPSDQGGLVDIRQSWKCPEMSLTQINRPFVIFERPGTGLWVHRLVELAFQDDERRRTQNAHPDAAGGQPEVHLLSADALGHPDTHGDGLRCLLPEVNPLWVQTEERRRKMNDGRHKTSIQGRILKQKTNIKPQERRGTSGRQWTRSKFGFDFFLLLHRQD